MRYRGRPLVELTDVEADVEVETVARAKILDKIALLSSAVAISSALGVAIVTGRTGLLSNLLSAAIVGAVGVALVEGANIIKTEEITLRSVTKMMLAITPLYWAPKIFTSLQEEGVGEKIMGCTDAVLMTAFTSIMAGAMFSKVFLDRGLKFFVGILAEAELFCVLSGYYSAYSTWNKYNALEAETGESESSKLPILGVQLLAASTALASIAGVDLLAGVSTPLIVGVTGAAQLALHLYADKVIAERRNHAEVVYMV